MRTDEPELEAPQRVARDVFGRGIRLILSYVRMHPKPFALAVAGALLFAVGSVAVTIALGRVTDRVLRPAFTPEGVSAPTIWLGVAAVVGLACIRAAGIGIRRYFSGVMGSSVAASLRDRVSDRYRDLSLSYHRGRPTGELLAHMEADVEASIEVIYPVPFSVGVILLVVFALISLVVTDPFLTLVGLVVIPTLGLMNRAFARRMQAPVERAQERIGEVSAIAHESIDGALVVKTLGRENAEVNRLRTKAQELRDQRVRAGYVRATFEEGLEALPNLAVIVLLAIGSWRLSTGDVTLGTLDVRAEALTYGFDGFRVLDEVAFHIEENESVAIVGATGVGKSTLAQLIVRLDDPDSGEILLGGVNVRHVEPRSLRRAASIVFQESFLFANTVAENIGLDSDATRQDIERAATIARADRFIRDLPNGYDTVLGERGHTLSVGERQRVALARALVRSPRVLILDDATSAVDPTIEAEILAALRTNLQTTLIVVAYRLSTIRLADRVLYLDDGRIRATGSHDELMAEPGYAAMIRAYERRERRAATEQGADREAARR